MEWTAALFGFAGALVGAVVPTIRTKRTRLEDAYVDLAGATERVLRLLHEDPLSQRGSDPTVTAAWVEYGTAKARVRLQEGRRLLWEKAEVLDSCLRAAHPVPPTWPDWEEEEMEREEIQEFVKPYLEERVKHVVQATAALDQLLDAAREDSVWS